MYVCMYVSVFQEDIIKKSSVIITGEQWAYLKGHSFSMFLTHALCVSSATEYVHVYIDMYV